MTKGQLHGCILNTFSKYFFPEKLTFTLYFQKCIVHIFLCSLKSMLYLWLGCPIDTYLSIATITVDQILPFNAICNPINKFLKVSSFSKTFSMTLILLLKDS